MSDAARVGTPYRPEPWGLRSEQCNVCFSSAALLESRPRIGYVCHSLFREASLEAPKGKIPLYSPDEQAFCLREMRRLNPESGRHLREDLRDVCKVRSQVRLHKLSITIAVDNSRGQNLVLKDGLRFLPPQRLLGEYGDG